MLSFDGCKITLIMDKKFIFGKQICYICANDMFFCVIIYKVVAFFFFFCNFAHSFSGIRMTEFYYYGVAATVYIVSCWIFAAVRWWHTCNTPKNHRQYVWPDRKLQVLFSLMATVLLPYVIDPTSPSAWLLMKSYLLVCGYFYCAVLLLCFFGTVKQWTRWMYISWIMVFIVMVPLVPMVLNAWMPVEILDEWGRKVIQLLVVIVALLSFGYSLLAMWKVERWVREIRDNNFSNPNDFPLRYAKRVWFAPLIYTPLFWPAFLLDSPKVMAVQNLLMAVMNTVLLITVMPAWRRMAIIREDDEKLEEAYSVGDLNSERMNEIAQKIEVFVKQQQGYLDEHLKIEHVVRACGYNRTYVSRVFQDRFGGFYHYVNQLRLNHFDQYIKDHSEMTKDAAARASGFSSYQAYYRAKERVKTI